MACFVAMEPISISAATTAIVLNSARLVKSFHDLKASFGASSDTIIAICHECSLARLAVSQVQTLLAKDQSATRRTGGQDNHVLIELPSTLKSLDGAFSKLQNEASRLENGLNRQGIRKFGAKIEYLWNEKTMQDLLRQVRGPLSSINLIVNTLHA